MNTAITVVESIQMVMEQQSKVTPAKCYNITMKCKAVDPQSAVEIH